MGELLCFAGVWLVTYLMHSTLLLAGVGLIDHFRCFKSNATVELLWRVALVGGLVTTTFHCTSREFNILFNKGWSLGGLVALDSKTISQDVAVARNRSTSKTIPFKKTGETDYPATTKIGNSTVVVHSPPKIAFAATKYNAGQADLTYAYAERFALRFVIVLAVIWFVGAIMNTLRLVWLGLLAHSQLRNRRVVEAAHSDADKQAGLPEVLPQKLSISANIEGPIALPNGEIVVPPWIFDSLSFEHRQAVYAHEIAHQIRRDPIWLLFLHSLSAIVWIQPLHRQARRRLVHLAELQADAWAARTLSNTRVLAESLFACAERVVAAPKVSFGSSFSSRGALIERIDCLLDGAAMAKPRPPYVTQVTAIGVLLFAMFLMPGCNVDSEIAYRSGEKISVTKQGDGKKGEASIRRANLLVKLSHSGSIKLSPKNDDVEMLEKGGRFQLSESQGKTKRIYTITADDLGNLERTFSQDGKTTPIDAEAQVWFAEVLERTVRESGF